MRFQERETGNAQLRWNHSGKGQRTDGGRYQVLDRCAGNVPTKTGLLFHDELRLSGLRLETSQFIDSDGQWHSKSVRFPPIYGDVPGLAATNETRFVAMMKDGTFHLEKDMELAFVCESTGEHDANLSMNFEQEKSVLDSRDGLSQGISLHRGCLSLCCTWVYGNRRVQGSISGIAPAHILLILLSFNHSLFFLFYR